jgi:hypothetical protein
MAAVTAPAFNATIDDEWYAGPRGPGHRGAARPGPGGCGGHPVSATEHTG